MGLYEVLGVRRDATADELRRAYLALARRHHPDYFTAATTEARAAAERRMQVVNEAWAVLGDPARRRAYDAGAAADEPPERAFRPHDTGIDDSDPRDQPDVPYRPAPPPSPGRRLATVVPVALFALAVAGFAVGLVLASGVLMGLAALAFVGACLGFLVLPLLALGAASRDEG
jgi:curved DNA-binding protein CbpA